MPKIVRIKIDRGPVADLKRPYQTRHRSDSSAAGAIELAYQRGRAAGREEMFAVFSPTAAKKLKRKSKRRIKPA